MVIIDYQGTTSNFSEKYFCTNGPSNKHKKLGPDPPSSSPDRLPACLSVWSGWSTDWSGSTGWFAWFVGSPGSLVWLTG
nr:MAG TPA: hypothetical protein [Caudoviricetes sp.]